jgi:Flp pilus assembly protein TadB
MIVASPMSFQGSLQRIRAWGDKLSRNWRIAYLLGFAWWFLATWWLVIVVWYFTIFILFGIWVIPYRLVRRKMRREKALMRRDEVLKKTK